MTLRYSLKTPEGLTVKDGTAVALIYSPAKREGSTYRTAVGTSTPFTLAVLHQKPASTSRANTLQVDALPFLIGTQASELKAHELKRYKVSATGTPALADQD